MRERPQEHRTADIDPDRYLPAILYGSDYYPEQWITPEDGEINPVWQEDLRLMQKAGINCVSIGVFSWVSLQPAEDTFTFDWLDQVLDLLAEHGIVACLGTGTAAQPAWLSAAYPSVLPVDESGVRHSHGGRLNYCPTNPHFRRLSRKFVRALAERYQHHPALFLWHVSNEYGPACYCEHCAARFREWLQQRYGTLAELNRRWVTAFWSHTYTSWEQVQPPGRFGERSMQGLTLDYQRFISDVNLECYLAEKAILREVTPHIPVTTNFHGLQRRIDYFAWAPSQDVISWDYYSRHNAHPSVRAFHFDLMRGLKDGQPWLLLEQTPSQVQWQPENPLKRPGVMRLHSYQALAHGSNSVMFFQWRQSRSGEEMYHGAIVSHAAREDTRVFREVAALGSELRALQSDLLTTRTRSRVALLMSWPNWWAVENEHVLYRFNYLAELQRYYRALWDRNIAVDILSPDAALDGYDLVLAPLLNMVSQEQGAAIERYVEQGGTFLTTCFSGVVDEQNRAWLGGAPGPLRCTLGLWVEEVDPLPSGASNTLINTEETETRYQCEHWCEVVHLEGARALSVFGEDFYAGSPAITEHAFGSGRAIYVATCPDDACLYELLGSLCHNLSENDPIRRIFRAPADLASSDLEITQRRGEQTEYTFVLNHLDCEQDIPLLQPMRDTLTGQVHEQQLSLPARGVAILVPAQS